MALCDIFLVYIYRYTINISVTTVMIRIRKFLRRLAAEDGVAVGSTSALSDNWLFKSVIFASVWGGCAVGVAGATSSSCSGGGNSSINFNGHFIDKTKHMI